MSRKFRILLLWNLTYDENIIKLPLLDPRRFYDRPPTTDLRLFPMCVCVNLVISLSPATQHTQNRETRRSRVGLLNIIRGNFGDFGRRRAPQFRKLSELFRAHWYRKFLIAPVFIELPRISTRRPEYSARRSSWNSPLFHNRNTFRSVLHRANRAEWYEMRDWSNHEIRFSGTLSSVKCPVSKSNLKLYIRRCYFRSSKFM